MMVNGVIVVHHANGTMDLFFFFKKKDVIKSKNKLKLRLTKSQSRNT